MNDVGRVCEDGDMHVALVQMSAATDSATNRESVGHTLSELAAPGQLDLVVFPEGAMHDFGAADHALGAVAEPLDGPFVSLLADHARRLRTTVVAGIFERTEDAGERSVGALPYNTLVAIGPDGALVATYRKVHLYDSFGYRESERLAAGPLEPAVIDVADRRVGLMTCYDLRFPEHARLLVDAGADVLCVPAAWVRGPLKERHWMTLLVARAIENTVDVLATGQCGPAYIGHTCVIDPMGVVVAAAGEQPATVRAGLDRERLQDARRTNPSLANRRIGGGG